MTDITILHNPRCSKSRQTLSLLTEKGVAHDVILYLTTPMSLHYLTEIKDCLGFESIRDMMRVKETIYKELDLKNANESALTQAIVDHPILLERPIVIAQTSNGSVAKIGRPPENVLDILP